MRLVRRTSLVLPDQLFIVKRGRITSRKVARETRARARIKLNANIVIFLVLNTNRMIVLLLMKRSVKNGKRRIRRSDSILMNSLSKRTS
jgi:hypothetical protein